MQARIIATESVARKILAILELNPFAIPRQNTDIIIIIQLCFLISSIDIFSKKNTPSFMYKNFL